MTADAEVKETARVEAFSDGVFSIAITLLVLELRVPSAGDLTSRGLSLGEALLRQWPSFLGYVTSFATILVMWVNHHRLFTLIRRTSSLFLYLNGLLLLAVAFVPFPTAVLAAHLEDAGSRTAAAVYAGTFFAIAIFYNLLWRYASADNRLLGRSIRESDRDRITRRYRIGPTAYLIAFLLAFVSVPASVGLCAALALYFASSGSRHGPEEDARP